MNQIIPPYMAQRVAAYNNAQHLYNPALAQIEDAIAAASSLEPTEGIRTVLHFDNICDDPEKEDAINRARALKDHGLIVRSSGKRS